MEPIITDLNEAIILKKAITFNGKQLTEITLKKMILRPIMKRIVFMTDEIERIIVFEGESDFELHKEDSKELLIEALKNKIDSDYKK